MHLRRGEHSRTWRAIACIDRHANSSSAMAVPRRAVMVPALTWKKLLAGRQANLWMMDQLDL